jgi:hypothetical protein
MDMGNGQRFFHAASCRKTSSSQDSLSNKEIHGMKDQPRTYIKYILFESPLTVVKACRGDSPVPSRLSDCRKHGSLAPLSSRLYLLLRKNDHAGNLTGLQSVPTGPFLDILVHSGLCAAATIPVYFAIIVAENSQAHRTIHQISIHSSARSLQQTLPKPRLASGPTRPPVVP